MPALVMFKRKWLISCDDLVIPFIIEAILRIAWLVASLCLMWLKNEQCEKNEIIYYLLYFITMDLVFTSCLSVVIFYVSSMGSNMEVEKRRHLPMLLYLKLASTFLEIFAAPFLIWFIFINIDCDSQDQCIQSEIVIFIKITSICLFGYCLIHFIGMFLFYNSLGSSKYWAGNQNENKDTPTIDFFKRAEDIWQLRLKIFCCCIGNKAANKSKYVEISSFLASFLNNIDLVPSDIATGLVILAKKHAAEKKQSFLSQKKSLTFLETSPVKPWMTAENALHFLRIAKSTYGWLAFFDILHPCNLCVLMSPLRCCCRNSRTDNTMSDSPSCNTAAVQKITGFSDADIVHASFHNAIHEPAFYIAIDHKAASIVIAIRGTVSLSDMVTDIDADATPLPQTNSKFKCHSGILKSAIYLHEKITELNILPSVFAEHPNYTLALAGHSLGGSVAAILGYFLRPKYPSVQCYAFAPLAVLSASMVEESTDFVLSVVVGDDMSARLCVDSCKTVRCELIKCLHETKIPKYKILMKTSYLILKRLLFRKCQAQSRVGNSVSNNMQRIIIENVCNSRSEDSVNENDTKLYAPGRVLFLEETPSGSRSSWVTGLHFDHLIISPKMIADHQPHAIQAMLEKIGHPEIVTINIGLTGSTPDLS